MDIQNSSNIVHHQLTLAFNCHAKLMRWRMKRECIMELKTQGFVDQLVEDLAHCNWFDAIRKFRQNQKPNNTKDTSNRLGKRPMATWEFN
jgi:hypothetical protein